jgi:hypothetical protein
MRRLLLPVLAVVALATFVTACGASGGAARKTDDRRTSSDGTSSDATSSDGTSSDNGSDDTGSDETGSDDTGSDTTDETFTTAELEDILPTVDDVGPEYHLAEDDSSDSSDSDSSDSSDDTMDQAMLEACPGLEVFQDMPSDDTEDELTAKFEDATGAGVEVSLDPSPEELTEDKLDQIVEALNGCDTITFTDPDMGDVEMRLAAERDDTYGEMGAHVTMGFSFSFMGTALDFSLEGNVYLSRGLGVSVMVSSGLDDSTFETVPPPTELLPKLAAEMERRVADL